MTAVSGRQKTCQRCRAAFVCSVDGKCWCMEEPMGLPLPKPGDSVYSDCLCRACLREMAAEMRAARQAQGQA